MSGRPTRRLTIGAGLALLGAVPLRAGRADAAVEIRMRSNADGSWVGFDPVGLFIEPGRTVRWVCKANYHTATAYHPANGNRSLRIPRAANPWASDVLAPGQGFEVTLTVPGVYDYCCDPHEAAGMVGRLIVGEATGPGSLPYDWFKGRAEARGWRPVPEAARGAFPPIAEILRRRIVPARAA